MYIISLNTCMQAQCDCTLYYVSIIFDYLLACTCTNMYVWKVYNFVYIVFCNVFEHINPMTLDNMSLVDYIWLYIHDIACAMLSVIVLYQHPVMTVLCMT